MGCWLVFCATIRSWCLLRRISDCLTKSQRSIGTVPQLSHSSGEGSCLAPPIITASETSLLLLTVISSLMWCRELLILPTRSGSRHKYNCAGSQGRLILRKQFWLIWWWNSISWSDQIYVPGISPMIAILRIAFASSYRCEFIISQCQFLRVTHYTPGQLLSQSIIHITIIYTFDNSCSIIIPYS